MPVGLPDALGRLSPPARRALVGGIAAGAVVAAAAVVLLPDATLTIVCRHEFRRGEITVAVDGDVVLADTLTGVVTRRFLGVVEKTGGSYSNSVALDPGRRTVEVHVKAAGYDRTRRLQGEFRRGEAAVLHVDPGRDLALSWRPAPAAEPEAARAPAAEGPSPLLKHASSILFTILGSIVSASIGVYVQDHLRARKSRKAAMAAAATQPRR